MREEDVRDGGDVDPGTTQLVLHATPQAVEIRARLRAQPSVDQNDPAALLQSEDGKARVKLVVREPSPDKVRVPGRIHVRKGVS